MGEKGRGRGVKRCRQREGEENGCKNSFSSDHAIWLQHERWKFEQLSPGPVGRGPASGVSIAELCNTLSRLPIILSSFLSNKPLANTSRSANLFLGFYAFLLERKRMKKTCLWFLYQYLRFFISRLPYFVCFVVVFSCSRKSKEESVFWNI